MPPTRADAVRNRQRVLDAAAEEFRIAGLDVPMSEVARRANVGIATLIRNFPAREDLVAAVFGPAMTAYADRAAAAAADPAPWPAFCDFIRYVCRIPQDDRGFGQVLTTMFPGVEVLEAERQRGLREFVRLVRRAKASGALRADFSPHDLPLILLASGGVARPLGPAADRLVGYLLQSFSSINTDALPALPPVRALYAALEAGSSISR
ncbi:TetR/AcrR family transcriptional regulator [Cryptosporangium phraense]|uniref:TetR/AcrR family transcriptional regulator n=1 Tax=Cryptosporangium phraense TaxID=2593070 RepID=A0A545AJ63_9ACTN|nr:TetR/AcrR family transcriptional regulator [Cryptosporangium phraense]TQS41353.1 TetR/AcrR family transcriptional regulator [Cryptosporangium phraense]